MTFLLWGEKSGTNPKSAPSPYTSDPEADHYRCGRADPVVALGEPVLQLQPASLRQLDAVAVHQGSRRARHGQPDLERDPVDRAPAGDVPADHRDHPGRARP